MKKKFSARSLLALALVVLTAALAVTVSRNLQRSLPEDLLDVKVGSADLALKQIDYTETQDGIPRWTLQADSAAHQVSEGVTRIENIRLTFLDPQRGDVVLTARQGTVVFDSREVTLNEQVVVQHPQGYTLNTERLQYHEASRLIESDAVVEMRSETGLQLTGRGLQLNVDDMTLRLLADVKARVAGKGAR
ncbi:MAG: LPS export ABC transporter periplasmic protein LptC [Trichloromonadaceae bacterium]